MARYSSRQPRYSATRGTAGAARTRGRSGRTGVPAATRRSPLPIAIIVAVLLLGVVCWVVGKGCGTQKGQQNASLKSYTTAVDVPVKASAAISTQFNDLKNSVNKVAKADVNTKLNKMEKDCESLSKELAKISVPSTATSLQPLAQLGLDMRSQGVAEYQKGIMVVLNNGDATAASKSITEGLQDLVVGDEVLAQYKSSLDAKLKASKQTVTLADPGKFVPNVDDASSASVALYVSAVNPNASSKTPGSSAPAAAENPSQAIQAYLKSKEIDYSGMSLSVATTSASDATWKIDVATGLPDGTTYFLVHQVNGNWTVVQSAGSFTAAQLKAAGAPSDLAPPSASTSDTSTDASNDTSSNTTTD